MNFHRHIIVQVFVFAVESQHRLNVLAMPIVEFVLAGVLDGGHLEGGAHDDSDLGVGVRQQTILIVVDHCWHLELIQEQTELGESINCVVHLMLA